MSEKEETRIDEVKGVEIKTPAPRHRGKGYLPDTHDKSKDPSIRALLGAVNGVPPQYTLDPFVDAIRDQGQTSACTGFAFARAMHVRCAVMGAPIAWPSPTAIYTIGRAMGRKDAGVALVDEGAMPNQIIQGMNQWGAPPDSVWPIGGFDPDKINDEPDLEELEQASACELTGYYRIDSMGAQRIADVKHAISQGYPVAIGVNVDQKFEDYMGQGAVTLPNPTEILGGHMLCLIGYKTNPDGTVWVQGVNSWGPFWGLHGTFWADSHWLTDDGASDLYAITVAAK